MDNNDHEGATPKQQQRKENTKDDNVNAHQRDKTEMKEAHAEDIVINNIFDHKTNTSRRHRECKAGEPVYLLS